MVEIESAISTDPWLGSSPEQFDMIKLAMVFGEKIYCASSFRYHLLWPTLLEPASDNEWCFDEYEPSERLAWSQTQRLNTAPLNSWGSHYQERVLSQYAHAVLLFPLYVKKCVNSFGSQLINSGDSAHTSFKSVAPLSFLTRYYYATNFDITKFETPNCSSGGDLSIGVLFEHQGFFDGT